MWREFVELAQKRDEPFAALCARFGVSRKTGYKWLNRFREEGEAGLVAQSRRPKTSPRRTPDAVVDLVLRLRRENPDWTVARIVAELRSRDLAVQPAASTVDLLIRRQREAAAEQARALGAEAQRFEPNYRWNVTFGPVARLADGSAPVLGLVTDTTTNFLVGAALLESDAEGPAAAFVTALLERHGLPWRLRWPVAADATGPASRLHTAFTVRLIQAGVIVEFAPAAPPAPVPLGGLAERLAELPAFQRGLVERSVAVDPLRALERELAGLSPLAARAALAQWRDRHNFGGRQEAMQRRSPLSLYRSSARPWPATPAEPAYAPEAEVRLVSEKGIFTYQRRLIHVGRAFAGHCVELKLTPYAERYIVLFGGQVLGLADLTDSAIDGTTSLPLLPA